MTDVLDDDVEHLREASRRLDAILNNTREAVFLMDHQQQCVYANAAAEALTGYRFEEMRGRPLHDVVHHKKPDGSHYPIEECPIDRAFPERAQMSGEELFVHKDGSFYPVAFTASPLLDGGGKPVGTVIEARNIAAEKARDAALRESEARFRNMADHAPVMMWVTDPTGYCTYLNRCWYEFTGQTEAEAEGFGWLDATHPDDRALAEHSFLDANARRAAFRVEYRLRRADGAYRWAIDAAAPRFGPDGEFLGYVGSVIDIDERREMEDALRRSEARLRFLAELDETLRSARDAPEAMLAAASVVATKLQVSRCAYADVDTDEENDRFVIRADYTAAGVASSVGTYSLDLFGPRAAADMHLGRILVVRDVAGELEPGQGREMFQAIGVDAIICCPLVRDGRLTAMMAVHQDRPRDWRPDEIELVETAAERCWAYVERVGAEARLRKSEKRYRQIVEGAEEFAIVTLDEAGIITSWNTGAERLLGFSEAEVIGRPGSIFFTSEDREAGAPEHEINRAGSSGRAVNERWHLRKDGSRFWGSGLMMAREEGGFLKIFRDRTAEHEAEARVRDSDARMSSVLDSMAEGFVLLDPEFRIVRINAEALRMDGRPESEIIGRTHWDVWPGSEGAPQGQLYKQLARDGGSGEIEVHYGWSDREGWFGTRAYATPEGIAIFFRDISDRKRAEAAFAEKAAEFEALAENVSQLAWMAEPDGHIYWYNKRWYEFTGATLDEMLGWGWQKVHHPDHVEPVTAEWSGCLSRGEPFESTFPLRGANGEYRWFLTRAAPIRDDQGRIIRWLGTNTDVTAQREAEERYRTLFTSIESGFCVAEVRRDGDRFDYRVVEANPAFYRQTGFPGGILGQWLREATPGLEEHWFEIYGRVAFTGEAERFEQGV